MRRVSMRRREFITLLGGAAAAWPLAAEAQQPAMPVVGFLFTGASEGTERLVAAFRNGLGETGYVEGRNVAVEYRWAFNDRARLSEFATDMVRRRVAVIAAPGGSPAALAAQAATKTIPIVFIVGVDPEQAGLVASLNRPGGNITGFTDMAGAIMTKRFGLLYELVPKAQRFGAIITGNTPGTASQTSDLQAAAATIGRPIEIIPATTNREIDAAIARLVQIGTDALVVGASPLFSDRRVQIAALTLYHRLPAVHADRVHPEAGGLMSYGTNLVELSRQVGLYTGRILKGEKPAELPVQRATKFEFILNLHTARLLGIEVPATLLSLADEVIE
jgi:putative ABC transport system substrate-binding protein